MSGETPYAIGDADSIGCIVPGGVLTIEYDVEQAQEQGHAKFRLGERDETFETGNIALGEDIAVSVAREAMDEMGRKSVYGFIVPDPLIATFISHFPDMEVYRR